jgi:hypothetical protein
MKTSKVGSEDLDDFEDSEEEDFGEDEEEIFGLDEEAD